MTNREMIANYNGLAGIRQLERDYFDRTGEKLFKGRVKIGYAIGKNMAELYSKSEPYRISVAELDEEYRDAKAEQEARETLRRKIVKSKESTDQYKKELAEYERKSGELQIIMKKEKDMDEYLKKRKDLLDIDVEDVSVHKISIDLFEGIDLDSQDLDAFLFMLKE